MGLFIVFRYNQVMIRREMTARISCGATADQVVVLKIVNPESRKQFWRINTKEFTYLGKMYDVVKEYKCGDTAIFYCLHDKKEEELLADYSLYLRRGADSPLKHNSVLALLHNLLNHAIFQNPAISVQRQGVVYQFPVLTMDLIPVYLAHTAPPPKSA